MQTEELIKYLDKRTIDVSIFFLLTIFILYSMLQIPILNWVMELRPIVFKRDLVCGENALCGGQGGTFKRILAHIYESFEENHRKLQMSSQ